MTAGDQRRALAERIREQLRTLRLHHLALAGVLLVAFVLRTYALTSESLWNDELSTVAKIEHPPWDERSWKAIVFDVHPPGHVVMTWLFSTILGDGEFALRLPSVLFGVGGVFIVYRLASRWYSHAAGFAAALLASVSPYLISHAQTVRAYSPLFLATGWTLLCWLDLLKPGAEEKTRRRRVLTTALVSSGAAYLHYSGLLFAATVGFLAFAFASASVAARKRLPDLLATVGLCLLFYAPWLLGLIEDLEAGGLGFLREPDVARLKRFPTIAIPAYVYFVVAMLAALGSGRGEIGNAEHEGDARTEVRATLFLALTVFILVLGFYIKSIVGEPIFNDRNLIVAWPPIFVLLGAAATRAYEPLRLILARGAVVSILAAVVVLDLVVVEEYYAKQTRQHFRQATRIGLEWIQNEPGSKLVVLAYKNRFEYYLRHFGHRGEVDDTVLSEKALVKSVHEQFDGGAERVLVLTGHKEPGSAFRTLRRYYRIEHHQTFPDATATLLEANERKRKRGKRRRGRRR